MERDIRRQQLRFRHIQDMENALIQAWLAIPQRDDFICQRGAVAQPCWMLQWSHQILKNLFKPEFIIAKMIHLQEQFVFVFDHVTFDKK